MSYSTSKGSERRGDGEVSVPEDVNQDDCNEELREPGFGEESLAPEEVSEWVMSQIDEVSRLLGVTFEGHEQEAMRLFSAIEDTWMSNFPEKVDKHKRVSNKLDRELRKLECSMSYGKVKT